MVAAGLVAAKFSLDPVDVMAEANPFRYALRVAAFRAVQTSEAEAAAKARKQ